jgi:hypothetical protein
MPWRHMGEWRYSSIFLDLATDGGEWSVSRTCRFTPRESDLGTHCIGGWVSPGVGLEAVEERKSYIAGNRTRAVQPLARRYTDRAILTPGLKL